VLLGAGEIDIFDFDRVELHNLTRSIFLRESDVGRPKATALAARAGEVDPGVRVRGREGDFRDHLSLARLARYDCAVAAVDNFEARLALSQMCLLAGVDLVNAGIDSRHAIVETYPLAALHDSACYECHLPESAYQRIAERYSCGGLKRAAQAERLVPTTAVTASVAGALAASAALRLGPAREGAARRTFFDTLAGHGGSVALGRNADCVGCSALRPRPLLVHAAGDWRAAIPAGEATWLRTSEPVIVDCECASCGDRSVAGRCGLRRARDFDDRIAICVACARPAVRVAIRDQFEAAELLALYGDARPPVSYLVAAHPGGSMTIDLMEKSDGQ
jgi:molybdopterin/thiamine biosynthesis adenylyltransferase